MTGKKLATTLVIAIALLLSFSAASALLTEDFLASGKKVVYANKCSSSQNEITVYNTGDIASSYFVNLGGDASKWTAVAPQSFILKAGEKQEIYNYLKVPCDVPRGEYVLETTITSKLGVSKKIAQTVVVGKISNLAIKPVAYSKAIDPCETAVFKFRVFNTGDFPETYEFSIDSFQNSSVFSPNRAVIPAGESKVISLSITPECELYGDYSFSIITKASMNDITAETSGFSLSIDRNYDFSAVPGEPYTPAEGVIPEVAAASGSYSMCEQERLYIPFEIKNLAGVANTYTLSLDKGDSLFNRLGWIELSGNKAELAPGQSAVATISVLPPEPMEKPVAMTLAVRSELGEIVKEVPIYVDIEICHIPEIAEGIRKIKAVYEPSSASVGIKNTGAKNTNYIVWVEGADWITAEPGEVFALSGETGTFNLNLNPSSDTPEDTYKISIMAKVDGQGVTYAKDIKVSLKQPRFSNMIFDEYLPYTLGILAVIALFLALFVAALVKLERTKDERRIRAEELAKIREEKRMQRDAEREEARRLKEAEREEKRAQREAEKEQRRKEKEEKQRQREAEREERRKQKEAAKEERLKEKEARREEKAKLKEQRQAEKLKRKEERLKAREERLKEKGNLSAQRQAEKLKRKEEKLKAKEERLKEKEARRKEKEKEREQAGGRKDKKDRKKDAVDKKEKKREARAARKAEKLAIPYEDMEERLRIKAEKRQELIKNLKAWMPMIIFGAALLIIIVGGILVSKYASGFVGEHLAEIMLIALIIILVPSSIWLYEVFVGRRTRVFTFDSIAKNLKLNTRWGAGLGEVIVRLKIPCANIGVVLKRGGKKRSFLRPEGKAVYQYFEVLRKNFGDDDVNNALLRFRVKRSWLRKMNVREANMRLLRFNDRSWQGVRTRKVDSDSRYAYYEADTQSFSLFAIAGRPDPKPIKPRVVVRTVVRIKEVVKKVPVVKIKKIIKEVPVVKIRKIPVIKIKEVIKKIPIIKKVRVIKEVPVVKIRKVPVIKIKEVIKKVPVIKREKVIKEVPVVKIRHVKVKPKKTARRRKGKKISDVWVWAVFAAFIVGLLIVAGIFVYNSIPELKEKFGIGGEADIAEPVEEDEPIEEEEEPEEEPAEEEPPAEPPQEEPPEELNETVGEPAEELNETPEEEINETIEDEPEGEINETAGLNETADEPQEEPAEEEEEEEEEPEFVEPDWGIPKQEWFKGEAYTLDLTAFFHDPDDDVLTFSHTPLEHITVTVSDGIAEFVPEEGWTGTELVQFAADDGKGGLIESNQFRLIVKEEPEIKISVIDSVKKNISAYSTYIMIGVLILVILILLMEFRKPLMKFLEE